MRVFLLFAFLFAVAVVGTVSAQTTEFTYQGSLQNSSAPATGNFDFEFLLYDSLTGGVQQGATLTRGSVSVANGTFSVKLDFGSQFPGANRFLEIHVRPTGQPGITVLAPRQPIGSSPYAVQSLNATNATTATTATNAIQLGGVAANQYVLTGDARLSDARPPTAGSANYIQNGTGVQATSNFNISGDGTAGGTITANIVNTTTQYNLSGSRILSNVGSFNLFAGVGTGLSNTAGIGNAFFGDFAGFNNATGNSNTFLGRNAGNFNTFGNSNTFTGSRAGYNNTLGNDNAFFGRDAGILNTSGGSNAFFGPGAGSTLSTGNNNTVIGSNANVSVGSLINGTAIGYRAFVANDNSLVLGSINSVNGATADTKVGIGTTAPSYPFSVVGSAGTSADQGVAEFASGVNDVGVRIKNTAANGRTWTLFSSGGTTGLCQGCLTIWDATAGLARLTADTNGNVGIGTTGPGAKLHVNGTIRLDTLGVGGSTQLCHNGSNQISTCSSSARYKDNINSFSSGLSLIRQLRPVTFNWKDGGMADMGLVAEEVNAVEPLLTTTNASGQVEGVKYDRVGVVLVNAVKEQQAQIEAQAAQIELQRVEIELLKEKAAEVDELKALVCGQRPRAGICKRRE
jgi:hypothetical protein